MSSTPVDAKLSRVFEIATYAVIVVVLVVVLYVAGWVLNWEILGLLTVFAGYTLVLVLPVEWFKIGPSGIEAMVNRLRMTAPTQTEESTKEAEAVVSEASESLIDPRSVFLDLSIEVEKKLRQLGTSYGISQKVGIGQLVRLLKIEGVLDDAWLLDALQVFIEKRNQVLHEGKIELAQSAIEIGTVVLGRLEKNSEEPLIARLASSLKKANVYFELHPRLVAKDTGQSLVPDCVIPDSRNPKYVIEVRGTLSTRQAYAIADLGRVWKAKLPDVKIILLAYDLTAQMKLFLAGRAWDYALDDREIDTLVALVTH